MVLVVCNVNAGTRVILICYNHRMISYSLRKINYDMELRGQGGVCGWGCWE